jgi:hypothetical protein
MCRRRALKHFVADDCGPGHDGRALSKVKAKESGNMELWHAWTGLLQQMLQKLATDWGLGVGLAIIVLTSGLRCTGLRRTCSAPSKRLPYAGQ